MVNCKKIKKNFVRTKKVCIFATSKREKVL